MPKGITDLVSFLLASAGAAAIVKVLVSRSDFLRDTWLNQKPFSCPLCMGFWAGCALTAWMVPFSEAGWIFLVIYRGLQAASFSWFMYAKITGEN